MGFLDLFRHKRKESEKRVIRPDTEAFREDAFADRLVRESFISGNCEIIVSADKQITDARKEYEVVTSYLTDIQRIDMIPKEPRREITETAERLLNLNKERLAMQHTPPKITMLQRTAIEESENIIVSEIHRLEENEAYKTLVERDLSILEKERDNLDVAILDGIDKTVFYKRLLIVGSAFIGLGLIATISIRIVREIDVWPLFILLILLGAGLGVFAFMVHRKNVLELKSNEAKISRAIYLLNKVKIKFVNVTNLLDYNYAKYHIESSKDLAYNWKEYMRIVEEEKRFKKAESLIDFNSNDLKEKLKAFELEDPGIWIYQCEALVDPKEMVEVRHRLNVRRQKLRKTIDYNDKEKKNAILSLRNFVVRHPEYEYETKMVMTRYKLT